MFDRLRALAARYRAAPPLGLAPKSPAWVAAEVELRAACRALVEAEARRNLQIGMGLSHVENSAVDHARARVVRRALAWYRVLPD